ncbi:thiamine phosphate synthase [Brevundimonas terrae]|uniref:Thiamine phosphate synthase n=1 Tax=Brevundimonas terrae TaxID=363631 RepID=A0ABN0Y337_9CAUL|nr:thiamine phosphate synthase [Brevundimonas terrae]NIJ25914.1 thiamine-phosphate pyrophosphorylase [Brevundimonas terrae]
MSFSGDADILTQTALALARRSGGVSPRGHSLPPLLFFTDPDRTPEPWKIAQNLPQGSAVVYRAFSHPDAEATGLKLRAACDRAGIRLLVGKDEALATTIKADGLHLPEIDMARAEHLAKQYPHWLLTCALHGPLEGRSATGLDAFVVSPVFTAGGASRAKPDLGIEAFTQIIDALPCPAYGLGGIHPANAAQLLTTRACGIAGVEAISRAFSR